MSLKLTLVLVFKAHLVYYGIALNEGRLCFQLEGRSVDRRETSVTKFLNFLFRAYSVCLIPKNGDNSGYQRGLGMIPIILVFPKASDGLGLSLGLGCAILGLVRKPSQDFGRFAIKF